MKDPQIQDVTKEDEGYRSSTYLDSEDVLSGGWGHTGSDLKKVGEYHPESYWQARFEEDFAVAVGDYNSLPYAADLNPVARAVIIMMLFNLGKTRFLGFKNMNKSLAEGDMVMAAYHGLDSRWRRQVQGRAHRLMAALMTGVWVG